ncbi:hypothetical protein KC358_g17802 [Hortaea werneckii]|nr:hypothetical protein KC358_g17802 [Hortaea werneckii]
MVGDNPTLASAEEATGVEPLNGPPSEPQPPQHAHPIACFFGADEPNYTYYPDVELLVHELGNLNPDH